MRPYGTNRRQPWGKGIVIVALTGRGQDDDRRRTLGAGFDAHRVKPVQYEAVRALLASPLMREDLQLEK